MSPEISVSRTASMRVQICDALTIKGAETNNTARDIVLAHTKPANQQPDTSNTTHKSVLLVVPFRCKCSSI